MTEARDAEVAAVTARLLARYPTGQDPPADDELEAVDLAASDPLVADSVRALAASIEAGDAGWSEVWGDPVARGQAGLDLLSAVMRAAARRP